MIKISTFIQISIICILSLSCSKTDSVLNPVIEKTSEVEKLFKHSEEFTQAIYSYENGIHAAVGYGIANSYLIEGNGVNIIIDATDSTFQAEKVYTEFNAINSNPIAAIIYTHNHGDHTLGAKYFVDQQDETPLVIAHDSTAKSVEKIFGILNPIISLRSSRMFGTALPEEEVVNVGIGPYLSVGKSAPGYVKPNVTFDNELKLNIAGIAFEFFHAPGETDDQIFVWLPEYKALFPGDNIYKTFPNLYTIRGTSHRDVNAWINSLDMMLALEPKHIFPSHTLPFSGESALDTLTIYRDGIQFIHDQTIRLMNQGMHPEEIIENIDLPEAVASSPYLQEFYGTVRWSVKSIFNGYLGWFSGNIAELDPTSTFKRAKFISQMVGGPDALFAELEKAIIDEEMQWALELSDLLLAIDHRISEVTRYRAKAALYIGTMASNPNKRNYFLSEAQRLFGDQETVNIIPPEASMLEQIPMDMFFDVLRVNLNPEKVDPNEIVAACFEFSSGLSKAMILRNQIAQIKATLPQDCSVNIKTDEQTLKQVLAGVKNPILEIANGNLIVDKDVQFLKLLTAFRP
ncbi:MBL fold metallo-hydrolase [Gammaproteobacteria bacterium]|nr:MBL fold metallo-hydrolase [Gammaproteobacteria bacterium]MDC0441018.1 MBL fold metallo-hydrolase [Gammaproteobacteria bacterium]